MYHRPMVQNVKTGVPFGLKRCYLSSRGIPKLRYRVVMAGGGDEAVHIYGFIGSIHRSKNNKTEKIRRSSL